MIDGLAFGVMPEAAEALSETHPLIAMVHHPLALESGVTPRGCRGAARERARGAVLHPRGDREQPRRPRDALVADYGVPAERITVAPPGTDRVPLVPRHQRRVRSRC